MTALLTAVPCLGCDRQVVQGEDGIWRHPGGLVDTWACARCHKAASNTLPTRPCVCFAHDWQLHQAAPDLTKRPPRPSVQRVGVRTMVDVGWSAWSSTRQHGPSDQPIGGVIVDVAHGEPDDDGEVERIYTCVDPYRGSVVIHRIHESEVQGEAGFEAPESYRLRLIIARLLKSAWQEMTTKDGRAKALTPGAADRIRWAARLVGVVMGSG